MAAMEDSVRSALKELCGRWQQQLEADMQQQLQLQVAKCEDLSRLAEHRLLRELRFESKSSESLQKKGQVPLKALGPLGQSEASEASPASPRLGPAWSVSLKVADADGHEIQGAEIADGVDSNDVHHNMVRRSNSYEDAKARGNRMRFHRAEMQRTVSLAEAEYEHCQERIQRLPLSPWFDVFWALVIASNAAYLGIELSAAQQNSLAVHFGYACLFSIELVMRLYAAGFRAYICDEGWAWNWLDLTVVSTSWVDIIMDFLGESAGTTGSSFRVLRLFRVSRLLRIVKTLWIVRFVGALRTLVSSLMDTLKPLFWAMCLLLIIIYIAALLFTDVVLQHLSENPNLAPMKKYFGDLGISIQTLFRSISGGIDWADAADALTPLGDFWVLLFQFYIAFATFAVLNVMTGVFCNSALKAAEQDHENRLDNRQEFRQMIASIFSKMDDGDGQLTLAEFEKMFEDERMQAFLETAEINASDAWTLFASLDVDGDRLVDVEEFTKRCMTLRGPARSMDIFALTRHNLKIREQIRQLDEKIDMMWRAEDVVAI